MHFFTAATALIASTAVVLAAPAPSSNAAAMQSINDSAAATLQQLQANGCNYLKCVAALASETAACGAAAAELGVNILADLACFGSVGANIAGQSCNGCF